MNDNTLSNTDSLNDIVKDGRQQLARGRNDFLLFNSQTVSPGTNLSSLDALKRDYLAYADVLDKALTLTEQGNWMTSYGYVFRIIRYPCRIAIIAGASLMKT